MSFIFHNFPKLLNRAMDLDFTDVAGPSSRPSHRPGFDQPRRTSENRNQQPTDIHFDIFTWYPHYQRCVRHFLDDAQHSQQVQTLAAFVNICLPCQKRPPIMSSKLQAQQSHPLSMGMGMPPPMNYASGSFPSMSTHGPPVVVSLIPYIRRLIVTGFDAPNILHGFFGDDWREGIGSMHEVERRNYLFATKSGSWLDVKGEYDLSPLETVPFLKPLQHATEEEISAADKQWSDWLAMQDWMVGPRALDILNQTGTARSPQVKSEPQE